MGGKVGGKSACFTLIASEGRPLESSAPTTWCVYLRCRTCLTVSPQLRGVSFLKILKQIAGVCVLLYCSEKSLCLCGAVWTPALDVNISEP